VKAIKLALISFVILFLLVTVISLFIPSNVRISKALQMNASKEKVMEQVANAANWKNWFPGMDTAQLFYVAGKVEGMVLNEKSKRFLAISERNENGVQAEYKGIKQKKVMTGWNIMPDRDNTVTVQWYMDFTLRWYPWEKFSSILFEKQYGPQMEQGLSRMKNLVENN
jgi:Polyketide cyclase / dehydrase and lipid transport